MRATGIVRKIDELGRIVLPKETRKILDIEEKDALEIYVGDGGEIILKKYEPACLFCGEAKDVILHESKHICKDCIERIKAL